MYQAVPEAVAAAPAVPASPFKAAVPVSSTKRSIGLVGLCSAAFFNVCGGVWGSEEIMSSGPAVGLASLVLFPIFWCIPMAMVTAELSCAYPGCNGGYTVWVAEAFGPFWGFTEGYWSWFSGVVDNALYPVLGMDILKFAFPGLELGPGAAYLTKVGVATLLTIPNLLGLEVVETSLISFLALVMAPTVVYTVLAAPEVQLSRLAEHVPLDEISVTALMGTLFWSFNGFTGMSTFAAEVQEPRRTYPRAMAISIALIALTYAVPLGVSTGVGTPDWSTYTDGSFTAAGEAYAPWLGKWMAAAATVASVGQFVTELMVDSYQLEGMARIGLAPKLFAWRHPRFNTPWNSLIASWAIICVLVSFSFDQILAVDNCFSAVASLLILAAAIKLRLKRPNMVRPYKLGPGLLGLCLWSVPPTIITLVVVVTGVFDNLAEAALTVAAVAVGVLLYVSRRHKMDEEFRNAHRKGVDEDNGGVVAAVGYGSIQEEMPPLSI